MKLALRIQLVLTAAIVVIMIVAASVHVMLEVRDYEADMTLDHEFLAGALRDSVVATWSTQGEDAAKRLIDAVNHGQPSVRIRLIDLASNAPTQPRPLEAARLAIQTGAIEHVSSDGYFFTFEPVRVDGAMRAVELAEKLDREKLRVRASILHNTSIALAMILASTIVTGALGILLIGKPIRELESKAKRIGAGDLSGPLVTHRSDEIGALTAEMNAMCERLDAARQQVASETAARIAAMDQLRHADRLRTVGQLASGLAHELGTPLNVILGRAGLIDDPDATREEDMENARIIAEQTRKMTGLVRQLLDFARRRGPEPRIIDLREVTQSATSMLGHLALKARVTMSVEAANDPVVVAADPAQLEQVVTNLAVNGIQAMTKGGTLHVLVGEREATPPAGHGASRDRYAFIEVADDGVGIPPENVPHLFDPFFTTKDVGEGTGLGLSVTYGIVRDHGGWIEVNSALGAGSRFVLYLPRAASNSPPTGEGA